MLSNVLLDSETVKSQHITKELGYIVLDYTVFVNSYAKAYSDVLCGRSYLDVC